MIAGLGPMASPPPRGKDTVNHKKFHQNLFIQGRILARGANLQTRSMKFVPRNTFVSIPVMTMLAKQTRMQFGTSIVPPMPQYTIIFWFFFNTLAASSAKFGFRSAHHPTDS
jgi:hypothetical protein